MSTDEEEREERNAEQRARYASLRDEIRLMGGENYAIQAFRDLDYRRHQVRDIAGLYRNTRRAWAKQAEMDRWEFMGSLAGIRDRMLQRLERAHSAYEKTTGKKLSVKSIKKAEERAKLAESDRQQLCKMLFRMLTPAQREPLGFNRHQYLSLNTNEIKEKIEEAMPGVEELLQAAERISGNSRDSLKEDMLYQVHNLIWLEYEKKEIDDWSRDKLQKMISHKKRVRFSELMKDGIPKHVAEIMSESEVGDEEGITLLRTLRGGNITDKPANYKTIVEIEEMVFSGKIGLEDGLLLVENSNHGVLVSAIHDKKIEMDFARDLLTQLNFSSHPEATAKIVGGGDLKRVALLFGITPAPTTEPEEVTPEAHDEEEGRSGAPVRGRSRFSD